MKRLAAVGRGRPAAAGADLVRRSTPAATRSATDLWIVLAATLGCYGLSMAFEANEALLRWMARYESLQLDELPLTGLVFASGLAWYALRRRGESQAELRLRVQAEARASELLARNRELAQQLIAVQENERLALARELHDELGQRCSAILVETACLRRCRADDRATLLAVAARADLAARSLYQLVGGMLRRLRPADLDALGLVAALQQLCEAWEERSGVACVFHREGFDEDDRGGAVLPERINIAVYRVAQEALTNVLRHARATRVRLALARDAEGLRLSIADDGLGMDPARATRGLGLLGAGERAAALGGTLHLDSSPGTGVRLVLRVPLPALVDEPRAPATGEAPMPMRVPTPVSASMPAATPTPMPVRASSPRAAAMPVPPASATGT